MGKVAFVTGASRGIGRASALALAEAGYDVAIAARTVREGDGRVLAPTTGGPEREIPLPGSLESTAAAIAERGREALAIPLDLAQRDSIRRAVERTLAEWGRIDLLLNNAIWSGPGLLDPVRKLSLEVLETVFARNVTHQLYATQLVLESMLARGRGTIMNMTSSAGQIDAPQYRTVELGMLGYAHCASKGAFHRLAPMLQAEHGADGIRAFNVDPGFTWTESMSALGLPKLGSAPPEVTGAVVAWLATAEEASEWEGRTVFSHDLCAELGLLPGWPPEPAARAEERKGETE